MQPHMSEHPISEYMEKVDRLMKDANHLLIVVHTNPDPDAIATASALKYLVGKRYDVKTSIAFSGNIGRAENRAMLKELNIYLKQISKISWEKYDRIALVDTQPGSGNNMLPDNLKCDIVLDHHPPQNRVKAAFVLIEPDLGVLATMLIEWLMFLEYEIPPDLASALVYAINSESQHLIREVNQRDITAYLYVYIRSNLRKLARIMMPPLPRQYFLSISRALREAKTYRNLILAHLGDIDSADIVSEMADFLVRHARISWSLCTGRFKNQLIISIRSRNAKAKAGELARKLVENSKTVGGHGMFAGGYIDVTGMKKNDIDILENNLSKNFAQLLNYDNPEWKTLLPG
jgi:nanoRNase/pAp phosphatase (c-di-AMP/oligoRNAs hydrolase)